MTRLFAALSFLTRVPVPGAAEFGAREVGRGSLCFPLVGALLGAGTALVVTVFHVCGLPVPVAVALGVGLSFWGTGALHQDAWCDFVDGFGGGRTREDVLRIMKDAQVGAFGATALLIVLLVRTAAVCQLVEADALVAVVTAGACGRLPSVWLAWRLPYARAEGKLLGRALTDHVGVVEVVGATATCVALVAMGAAQGCGPWVLGWTLLCGIWFARACQRRLGGVTGDTLGACTEACEVGALVVLAAGI